MAQARVANKLAVLHPDLHPIALRASSWEGREAAIRFINHLDDATLAAVRSWDPAEDEVFSLSLRMQQLGFDGGVYEGRPITDLGRARRCMDLEAMAFYGCYLLQSKNPQAKGRSYIG